MRITWLSSRVLGTDLCSTTQVNLAEGLVARGHEVTMYSPGKVYNQSFTHIPVKRSSIRGLQGRSVARQLAKRRKDIAYSDVILIDWTLGSLQRYFDTPTILMDRGPPADKGLLSWLQWFVWKKAWSKAARGTVVSQAHREFVMERTGMPSASIGILPAGVELNNFNPGERTGPIDMVYHGRVDTRRGVRAMPAILAGLHDAGVEARLHIHGYGDALTALKAIQMKGLNVTGPLPQEELANLLSTYDVGLLPMPADRVWNLASPLKRSEYLASGLIVAGIDHGGHRIKDSGDWLQLFSQEELVKNTVDWIMSLDRQMITALQKEAREYAEEHSSWSHSVDALESMISS